MAMHASMAEALRLTRSGDLRQATALLRSAMGMGLDLGGGAEPDPPAASADRTPIRPRVAVLEQEPPAARTSGEGGTPRSVPDAGGQGVFEEQVYGGREGRMSYRLYRPAQARPGMPLIVMLHGCTQSPEDFARGTGMNRLADAHGFLVVYPRQTQAANPQKCWNWFKPQDQQRDRGEPALLAAVTRQVIADHGADADRVYVAGLSAGGAAAAIMAAEYPDIYAAVGVHSGLACGAARDLPSALAAMKHGGRARHAPPGPRRFVPVITFHGDRDATVHEANSREIVAAASAAAGLPLEVRAEDVTGKSGRGYRRERSVDAAGNVLIEQWTIKGSGHAWSGGDASGTYTDPSGPDASSAMVRFFLDRQRR